MADLLRPDLTIIGAGALGIALAQHARRLGAEVTLVDRGPEAGDGPEQGARVAALQASASRAQAVRMAGAFGIGAGDPKISIKAVQERAATVARELVPLSSTERLSALGVHIVKGETRFTDANTLMVGDTPLKPRAVVIAAGASPSVPDVPGLREAGYFTADSILDNTRKLTHLLVLGGDPDAFALAQAHARLGTQVTLVPQGRALPGFDAESVAILLSILKTEGVRVIDGGVVREILPRAQGIGAVMTPASGDDEALDLSHVLVADGRLADVATLGPETARLKPVGHHYATGTLGQTGNRRVRVVGAAAGMTRWHHALSHGRAVVEALVLGAPLQRLASQPRLVQTEPALAEVGVLSLEKARTGEKLYRESLAGNEQALALGFREGIAKVRAGDSGQILGASVVAPGAAELAGVLALAMAKGVTLDELAGLSLPHPSLMALLVRLGETHRAGLPASGWRARLKTLRRRLPA